MKQIKNYIGKEVAVQCSSQEEWNKIIELISEVKSNHGPTQKYLYNNLTQETIDCLNLKMGGTPIGTSSKDNYLKNGYIVFPASDFLEEDLLTIAREKWIPKVGDWVYAEKSSSKDWRIDKYIPLFQVKEIKYGYLRPEKDVAEGIDIEFCRKALPNEIPIEQQSIKQYPLTKEECFIDLKNTKIWIGDNPELSRKVQEIAIKLGFSWYGCKNVDYTNSNALYFDNNKIIQYSNTQKNTYFSKQINKEIFPSDLGINETTNYYKVDIFLSNTDPIDFLPKKEEFPTANKIIYSEKKQIKLTELEIPKPIKIFKR